MSSNTTCPTAAIMSMDGFHLPRSALDKMPDPVTAHKRRGSPWTFDAEAAVEMVRRCRSADVDVAAPTFDHAVKDPVKDGVIIPKGIRILIFEGNYLLSSEPPWGSIAGLVDERWYINVDQKLAR